MKVFSTLQHSDARRLARIARNPLAFTWQVLRQFRASQGFLLAGAIAYYAMLSLVPLLILSLILLSQVFPQERVLDVLREYLEFIVPKQSAALVDGLRAFLTDRATMGIVLFATVLFFSSLAFTALENAISVIFHHRVKIRRRHFLVSAVMPYLFILFLTVGLVVVTLASGILKGMGERTVVVLGQIHSLGTVSSIVLYLVGVAGEGILLTAIYLVMPVGRLSLRHAVIGGAVATVLWEITRHLLAWYYATVSQIQVVYGTLASAVGVLLSAELGALVLLMGAQVIAEYERLEPAPLR